MATRNKNNRPITIGDVNKFRKNVINGAYPILFFLSPVLIVTGIFSFFLDPYVADYTAPLGVVGIIFGLIFIPIALWAKSVAKKL